SEVTNVSMGFDEERRVYALYRTFWSLGVQRFRIAATDWGGSWVSAEATFTIVDSRPPDILEATVLPSVNELGASMTLRARILDNSTLASVSAGIWHWSGSTEDNITLQLAGSGYWEAVVVPKEAGNYIVSIWAIDVQGNAAVKGLQFRVFRGSPPVAEITAPTQAYPEQLVTISGGLSADDFGIESFTWTIEGPDGTVTLDGSVINYVFEETGTYRVILVVRDRAGNLDSDERQIRVRERPVQMPLPPIYLFILSVAVTLLVLWLWLVRRRAR
ncbi:MAG: PKD domain-containing protein, partial [Thermoplasmata archaeon]